MTINEEDLDLDEDVRMYMGTPFTGIAQSFHYNGGLRREIFLVDGFQHGICKEWYDNGQQKSEWHSIRGRIDGRETEWYENGQIKSIAVYMKGVELAYDEWSDTGLHVLHREFDRTSELWKYASNL